jgi:flagellin-like protein
MNVLGKKERSWRKARKRGVSPIIATILLVAITVVLAAVLYVLISGLTHGTGTAPLGTNFSWGSPVNATGTSATGCAATFYCYTIEIAGAGGGVTTSNFQLALRTSLGSTVAWPASLSGATVANGWISLYSPSSANAVATYSVAASAWTNAAGFTGTIGGGFSITLSAQGHAEGNGQGLLSYQLVAIGVNGYSGTVPSSSFA